MTTKLGELSLTMYRGGKGLPAIMQESLKHVSVYGNDLEQIHNMILYAPETSSYLKHDYSPTGSAYRDGTRSFLQGIALKVTEGYNCEYERIEALLSWVSYNVRHALVLNNAAPDSYLSEEDIISRGWGWCNEQARVFNCLAQTCDLMTRICFLMHESGTWGHTVTEVFLDNEWVFADPTIGIMLRSDHNSFLTVSDIQNESSAKVLFDYQYRCAQINIIERWMQIITDSAMEPTEKSQCVSRINQEKHKYVYDSRLLKNVCISNYII